MPWTAFACILSWSALIKLTTLSVQPQFFRTLQRPCIKGFCKVYEYSAKLHILLGTLLLNSTKAEHHINRASVAVRFLQSSRITQFPTTILPDLSPGYHKHLEAWVCGFIMQLINVLLACELKMLWGMLVGSLCRYKARWLQLQRSTKTKQQSKHIWKPFPRVETLSLSRGLRWGLRRENTGKSTMWRK